MGAAEKINRYFFGLQSSHALSTGGAAFELDPAGDEESLWSRLREAGYDVERLETREIDEIYHDTFDLRLHRSGRCLLFLPGLNSWRLEETVNGGRFCLLEEVGDYPAIMDEIRPALKGLALYPLVRAARTGTLWSVAYSGGDPMVMTVERASYRRPGAENEPSVHSYTRVLVNRRDTDEKEADILSAVLRDLLGLRPAGADFLTEGMTGLGIPMAGLPVEKTFPVAGTVSIGETCSRLIMIQAYRMWSNRPGAMAGIEIEYVHDMRVATRRLRTLLKSAGPWINETRAGALRKRLKNLAGLLGEVRDGDVFESSIGEYLDREHGGNPAAEIVRIECAALFRRSRQRLLRVLGASGFFVLLNSLKFYSDVLAGRNGPKAPPKTVAAEIIRSIAREILERAETPVSGMSTAVIHSIRIDFKRLRYNVEFFMDLYGKKMKKSVKELTEFQDCLGDYNDAVVALELLGKVVDRQRVKRNKSADALLLLGGCVEFNRRKAEKELKIFQKRWKGVSSLLGRLLKNLPGAEAVSE